MKHYLVLPVDCAMDSNVTTLNWELAKERNDFLIREGYCYVSESSVRRFGVEIHRICGVDYWYIPVCTVRAYYTCPQGRMCYVLRPGNIADIRWVFETLAALKAVRVPVQSLIDACKRTD